MSHSILPLVNASLNALAAFLLVFGFIAIRQGKRELHQRCMISAFVVSSLFLVCYVYHKLVVVRGVNTPFAGPEAWKPWYLTMLFSHIILAIAIVPLALVSISRGLGGRIESHRKIARWTFPIWMYVSITGVLIYLILYQFWPQTTGA